MCREKESTEVSCPLQQKDYCGTFHLIDKGNKNEAQFDMGGCSRLHNWSPKLNMRYFNMTGNNAKKIYMFLVDKYTPLRQPLCTKAAIHEMTHFLLQYGPSMRKQSAEHAPFTKDISTAFGTTGGRKTRSDTKAFRAVGRCPSEARRPVSRKDTLRKRQRKSPWRTHQSISNDKKGRCSFEKCPSKLWSKAQRRRNRETYMICEECSVLAGKPIYLCNDTINVDKKTSKGTPVLCHLAYHNMMHNIEQCAPCPDETDE